MGLCVFGMEQRSSLLRGTAAFFRLIGEELRHADEHPHAHDEPFAGRVVGAADMGVQNRGRGRGHAQRGRGHARGARAARGGRGGWYGRGMHRGHGDHHMRADDDFRPGWFEPRGLGADEHRDGRQGGVHVHCNDWAPGGPGARQYTEPCITARGRYLSAAERSRRNWRRHRQRQHRRQRMQDLLVRNGEMQRELAGHDPAGVREALFGPVDGANLNEAARGREQVRGVGHRERARGVAQRGRARARGIPDGVRGHPPACAHVHDPGRHEERERQAPALASAEVRFKMTQEERALLRAHGALIHADRIELQLPGDEIATVHQCTGSAVIAIHRHLRAQARQPRQRPPQEVVPAAPRVQREPESQAAAQQAGVAARALDVQNEGHEHQPALQGGVILPVNVPSGENEVVVQEDHQPAAQQNDAQKIRAEAAPDGQDEAMPCVSRQNVGSGQVVDGVLVPQPNEDEEEQAQTRAARAQKEDLGQPECAQDLLSTRDGTGSEAAVRARKRSASVVADNCASESSLKRRADSSSRSDSRGISAADSSASQGSRRAADYRGLASLGDVVRMFTGVGRGGAGPSNAGGKEVSGFEIGDDLVEDGSKHKDVGSATSARR